MKIPPPPDRGVGRRDVRYFVKQDRPGVTIRELTAALAADRGWHPMQVHTRVVRAVLLSVAHGELRVDLGPTRQGISDVRVWIVDGG